MNSFVFILVGLISAGGFAQSGQSGDTILNSELSIVSPDFVSRCEKASKSKPFETASTVNPSTFTKVRCWKDQDHRFALSELWLNNKKVYFTPQNALEVFCGSAAGEVYRPHRFSPDKKYFAFLLIPFCWETEPLEPVVMLTRLSDFKTKAPNFTPIAKEIFRRYPKAAEHKKEITFRSQIQDWQGKEGLLIDVDAICYGCFEAGGQTVRIPKSRWLMTPDEKFSFVKEIHLFK